MGQTNNELRTEMKAKMEAILDELLAEKEKPEARFDALASPHRLSISPCNQLNQLNKSN